MTTQPKIVISDVDVERLERLLEDFPAKDPARLALEAELGRAEIRPSANMPDNVVTMNSKVRFRVSSSAEEFCLTLVYPRGANGADTVSVMAPVGSALLGLAQGAEIDWPCPGGTSNRVRIEEVVYQPERAGDYHR
ncbi:nucleoside diphosphate kinase regulator [Shewanella sp. JM162201]|uniref:Nucleoside diphosphate kinase regulator n=1 Tax=Shewanella jiangmenensis TaxID=2837387 RepID=A0ABS5V5B9_9GAMM|nr:nucleoside diphosphate kinase regulator [Shewanella jiangmenensis]